MNGDPESKREIETPAEAEEMLRRMSGSMLPGLPSLEEFLTVAGEISVSAEARFRLTEAQYRTLLEQIPAVTFMASFEQGLREVYVSPQIETLLGYTQKEWMEAPSLWYARLHPEDKERWNQEFAPLVAFGTPFHSVYRFLARDGRVVWILGDARIVRDKEGRPVFIQGVGFDVTDLKRTEEELRKRTLELEASNEERRKLEEQIRQAQQREIVRLRSEVQKESAPEDLLVGSSEPMKRLRALLRKVASSEATLLVTGESGTGKELVARALHYGGPRAARPLVDVNCAAFTEGMPESELFGHEKGAFTGAAAQHAGKFEQAQGGTLFLDEIGDMPAAIQAKILRALQERAFERVGGKEKVRVDVRVICATNRRLEEAVEKGAFRADLYYRINTMVIEVPPLRERAEDIPELAEHFLARANRAEKRQVEISGEAMALLRSHTWPGNVRELKHAVERAVLVCDGDAIRPGDLPPAVARQAGVVAREAGGERLIEAVERMERSLIVAALDKSGWVKTRAAKSLGLNERVLTYKMNNLGIEKAEA